MWSTRTKNEVFVWLNGVLIYKKWVNTDQPSRLFNTDLPDREIVKKDKE